MDKYNDIWDEITYPFLNRWSLGMNMEFHPTLYWACDYLYMLGLKLKYVSKRATEALDELTWIPAWIYNYIHYKVQDEITYPFLNFNGTTVEI